MITELNPTKPKGRGISFAYTLPQLLSGRKTVTRRAWKGSYAAYIKKNWDSKLFPALDKSHYAGGKQVGLLSVTQEPYLEKLADMPDVDVAAEGFPDLSKTEFIGRFFNGNPELLVWVIRFDFIQTGDS
jgi:hypothetical protein